MKWAAVFCVSLVVILALNAFIGAAEVYAPGVCSDNQTIMRLARGTNAHGSLWDQSYGIKICYTDLFYERYAESDSHACTSGDSGDVVLKLSGTSNAHAAEKDFNGYSTRVCYRGLSDCTIESVEDCTEDSGKVRVVAISGTSNAHLSRWVESSAGYDVVCCKGDGTIIPSSVETANACYELSEDLCGLENGAIAASDPGCKAENLSSCRCVWSTTQNICTLEWGFTDSDKNCDYKCVIQSSEQTECSGGSQILSLIATAVPISTGGDCAAVTISPQESGCKSGSATVPCGGLEANLPFFGAWQILLSLMSVIGIYVLMARRKTY